MKPSYDEATLAAYFQPIRKETFDHPVAGPALRRLAREDPDIIAAVADVDRSLIRDFLALALDERFRRAAAMAHDLEHIRDD